MADETRPDKLEPGEARERGFTIDTHCYPWLAYKGPRFAPTDTAECYTDQEAELLVAIDVIWRKQRFGSEFLNKAIMQAVELLPARWRQGSAAA